MRAAVYRGWRRLAALAVAACLLPVSAAGGPDQELLGRPVGRVRVTVAGAADRDPQLTELVDSRPGEPLAMADVRATIRHLMALGRFDDVQVWATAAGEAVDLHYDCVPRRTVVAVVFRGALGLSRRLLQRTVLDRHGPSPRPERAADVAATVAALYAERGYTRARVDPVLEPAGAPFRVRLVLAVEPGVRARYDRLVLDGQMGTAPAVVFSRLGLARHAPYDRAALLQRIAKYLEGLRKDGYYEARLDPVATISDDGERVDLRLTGERGPRVRVVVAGVVLPGGRLDELVPVEREGSVDEDLLEDSGRNIVEFLRSAGYRDASVAHRREQAGGELRIVFDVTSGRVHRIRSIAVDTVSGAPSAVPATAAGLQPGDVFVQSKLDSLAAALQQQYRQEGYQSVAVSPMIVADPAPTPAGEVAVDVRLTVLEGERTVIGAVSLEGNEALEDRVIRPAIGSRAGAPFYDLQLRRDAEAILFLYLDRGYQSASIEPEARPRQDASPPAVDVVFRVREGSQVIVDRVLVTGNTRTSLRTIRREITLRPGQPIGLDATADTQRRLSALGLFRRVQVAALAGGGGPKRDVLVTVEEAPATTIGYGTGLEGGRRLRGDTGPDGQPVESLELAPRGSFEIGRRNLWGKNRSINLFTRATLRSEDRGADQPADSERGGLGLREYRALATFREPRAFGTRSDVLITGVLEQAVRSSFNFNRRAARAELVYRLSPRLSLSGRYGVEKTRLFNERVKEEDRLDIDRLFPQIRLSALSASIQYDTRDDPINPVSGSLVLVDTELAPRALGSEVGFAKTYVQGFWFRRLPGLREAIFAGGARLGLAAGFPRITESRLPDGGTMRVEVRDVPASERFFAGGDTTVRGFAMDRLGVPATLDPRGVPKGGNGLVILNGELRVPFGRSFGGIAFLDVGNVYARMTDVDPGQLRAGAGFGVRYQSPIGPVRFDLGFNLDRQRFADGTRESPMQWYVGIGHAF